MPNWNSDAHKKAVKKYHSEKIENITIHVPKGKKAYYKAAADLSGKSLNAFAVDSIEHEIDNAGLRDKLPPV